MLTTQILVQLRKIIRSVNLESKRVEKEYGLSIPQLLCLNYLESQNDKRATHKEIKEFLQLNASTVTGIVKRLEKKGLIHRKANSADRRVSYIGLSPAGSQLLTSTPDPLHDRLSGKLQSLSRSQLKELETAFQLVTDFLEIHDLEVAPILTVDTRINTEESAGKTRK